MCEAKQSERAFTKPLELAEAMIRLRPDVALLAVMEPPSPKLIQRFEVFARALEGTGVTPELMTLDEKRDYESAPWFHE